MSSRPLVVIAGGGTAGHVLPAIAIGKELVERGLDAKRVRFVGGRHGLEKRLVPAAGFTLTSVPGRGLPTSLSLRAVGRGAALAAGTIMATATMLVRRPRVVVSVGGYAAVPCGVAAAVLRIPLVVVEPNAVPGRANALLARFARACATGRAGTGLPREVVTGVPVRAEILAIDRARDREPSRVALGLAPDEDVVAVVGGSLGAGPINDAVADLVHTAHPQRRTTVYHVTGDRDFPRISGVASPTGDVSWIRVPYEERVGLLLAAADVVVGRAGASFVAEIEALRVPAVLVPLPGAPGDHQTHNARAAAEATGGVVLTQDRLTGAELWAQVVALIASGGADKALATSDTSSGSSGTPARSAASAVVDVIFATVPAREWDSHGR